MQLHDPERFYRKGTVPLMKQISRECPCYMTQKSIVSSLTGFINFNNLYVIFSNTGPFVSYKNISKENTCYLK